MSNSDGGGPPASRIFAGLPPCGDGQTIGLYGGSFNPPHAGHRQVSKIALARLGLDFMWWLVTPGNPLKDTSALPPLADRMAAAANVARHPRILVSGLEAGISSRYTVDLVDYLCVRRPTVRFVWVMGSDNLAGFDRWEHWRLIAARVPIAIVNRPGSLAAPLSARAAVAMARYRVDERDAGRLATMRPPAWTFLTGPRTGASSTQLRNGGGRNVNDA